MRRIYLRIRLYVNRHPTRKLGLPGRLLCWPIGRRNLATMNADVQANAARKSANVTTSIVALPGTFIETKSEVEPPGILGDNRCSTRRIKLRNDVVITPLEFIERRMRGLMLVSAAKLPQSAWPCSTWPRWPVRTAPAG
jgi:hypothetical protein